MYEQFFKYLFCVASARGKFWILNLVTAHNFCTYFKNINMWAYFFYYQEYLYSRQGVKQENERKRGCERKKWAR